MDGFEDSEESGTENRESRGFGNRGSGDRGFRNQRFGNRGFRNSSFGPREPREKRKTICQDCKKECEVYSFLKDPVSCSECYRKKNPRY
ncbi:MAG: DNA-directed RNA polymerase [Nanoarchaeota archaeon]